MKVDLNSIDRDQFMVHQHFLKSGEAVWLVQPQHVGCKWTQANKHLRSAVFNSDGELISMGFPKFVNWGENPENFPVPVSLKNAVTVEKLDGSLLIVSKYKGEYILRTRGTVDAETALDNGSELEVFKQLHSKFTLNDNETWNRSLLFEWLSPVNKIVINYGDSPEFRLVGIVNHDDGSLVSQEALEVIAKDHGFKRPETYKFDSVTDLLAQVDAWKGKEGVVVYTHNGQMLHKIKSADYLVKHRFKSEATLENTLELYFQLNCPSYVEFETKLVELFDWECFEMVRGYASSICDAAKQVNQIIAGITAFVEPLKIKPRKDAAIAITSSYGETGRSGMAFTLLDSKPLTNDQHKKLFWQVLKK